MSQENVERVRRYLDAFDQRDRPAGLALRDQNSEVVPSSSWPEADVIRGSEAAWDFYVDVVEAFQLSAFGDAELVEAGPDKVLVHQRNQVRGRTSGADVDLDYWVVITFREGKILRDEWFADH